MKTPLESRREVCVPAFIVSLLISGGIADTTSMNFTAGAFLVIAIVSLIACVDFEE